MNSIDKPIAIALALSVLFTIFNIIAVTQGTANSFYSQVEILLRSIAQ